MYLQEARRKEVERLQDPHRNDYADDNQAVYERYVQRLVDRYIKGNDMLIDGQGHDAAKFIQEMMALNGYYHSLGATNVGMGTESMYLSQNELALNVPGMVELEGTTHFAKALGAEVVDNNKYGDMRGPLEEAATKGRESILSSRAEWTSVDKIMDQNGYTGHVAVTHHNADGSEVIVDYNAQGEKGEEVSPKLDHITFQSGDEVDERNSRVAQSGEGTPQDFRIHTQPDPINMNTNPSGNLVVATLIAGFSLKMLILTEVKADQ